MKNLCFIRVSSVAKCLVVSRNLAVILAAAFLAFATTRPAAAQEDEPVPPGFEGATVVSKPNAQVPLDLEFLDEEGQSVRLGDFFHKDRPVLLAMVYFGCRSICPQTLASEARALERLKLVPGKDFEMLTVSFDPREGPEMAAAKKAMYVEMSGKPAAADGWHFLTSPRAATAQTLGQAIGFGFKLDPKGEKYLHAGALYVVTPEGRVSRVLRGVTFDPDLLRDSLIFASQGKISSRMFGFAVSCGFIHYDPATGRYTWAAVAIVNTTAILSVLVLGTVIGTLVWRGKGKGTGPCFRPGAIEPNGADLPKNGPVPNEGAKPE